MNDIQRMKSVFLVFLLSLAGLSSFFILQSIMSPSQEHFSEISVLGPGGITDDYPRAFDYNSSYQVRILVRNFEGQAEFYQVRIQFQFQDGQTLGFMPTISFTGGTRVGKIVENKGSWETAVSIGNGSQILERQARVGELPLKIQFILLKYGNDVFEETGNSVHLWAEYPS